MFGTYVFGDEYPITEDYMDEDWAFIDEFPYYMVSDKGRVWSRRSNKMLKPKKMDSYGHIGYCLSINGKDNYVYAHRLVAEAFLPNPDKLPIVRHLDDDPTYNVADNLAWGTQKDNMTDCIESKRFYYPTDEDRYKGNKDRMKSVIAINLKTNDETIFESIGEASRKLNLQTSNIQKVLNGERKHTGNYVFRRVGDSN